MRNVELIGMIYKSRSYLDFMLDELKRDYCKVDGWDVSFRIVCNDATQDVLDYIETLGINYSIYKDPKPDDYWLNRVYRAWNFGARTSNSDLFCFLNSDLAFSKDWLKNLLDNYREDLLLCSRLVESGKMPSGLHAIEKNFGRTPKEFNENRQSFYDYAESIKENKLEYGGLFVPTIFTTKRFKESGGYPEGNIYRMQDGTFKAGDRSGQTVMSGDYYFYRMLEQKYNMRHVTLFNSIVYHWQSGEMDDN